jgi:radical SAM protein with 4Fe4S-binding SPASM domain
MSSETYERVTGVPGSFERCLRGIEAMVAAKVPLRLKTVAMTLNKHELRAMYDYSASLGIEFRHDSVLRPTFYGRDIRNLRLSPEEVVSLDLVRPDAVDLMETAYELAVNAAETNPLYDAKRLYNCGAGFRSFHIDPYGLLTGCHMVRSPGYDLRSGSFLEGWESFLAEFRSTEVRKDIECLHCEVVGLCQRCPAFSALENNDVESVVEYACAVAHQRARILGIIS